MKKTFPGPPPPVKLYPKQANAPSRSGDFDQVWQVTQGGQTKYVVVEAKGGSSPLGSRKVGTQRVQQGTTRYFESIVETMRGSDVMGAKDAAVALEKAGGSRLEYLHVKFGIKLDPSGRSIASGVEVGEFDLVAAASR